MLVNDCCEKIPSVIMKDVLLCLILLSNLFLYKNDFNNCTLCVLFLDYLNYLMYQDLMDDLDGDNTQFDVNDDNILYDRPDKRGDNNNWVLLKDNGEDFADSEDTENGDTEDSKVSYPA